MEDEIKLVTGKHCEGGIRKFEEKIAETQKKGFKPKYETFKTSESMDDGCSTTWFYIMMVKN